MTYDGNKTISWAECLWHPDGSHLATAGDWYVRNPDSIARLEDDARLDFNRVTKPRNHWQVDYDYLAALQRLVTRYKPKDDK